MVRAGFETDAALSRKLRDFAFSRRSGVRFAVASFIFLFIPESVVVCSRAAESGFVARELFRVPAVEGELRADGILDEPFWHDALVLSLDYEVSPGENVPAPVKTECLLAYTKTHIYVGFRAFDHDASRMRAHMSDRDQIFSDDWVGVFFDTFNDGLRDYGFMCNPLGVQEDMVETSDAPIDLAWDAIWESAGRITEEGYFVEMAIPFSCLSFQRCEGDQVWGLDAVRDMPRSVRHHIGVFPRDRSNNCYMCQAIKIIGFAGAEPGRNIEIDPTLSATLSKLREEPPGSGFFDAKRSVEPGVSVRWGFARSMTASATVNPDFSQVEADAVQLDINSRFALFYSEKRPFFLEGADFFRTRLGILHTRTFADPDWGAKLVGKEGSDVVGVFVVRDRATNLLFPGSEASRTASLESSSIGSVLRYRRDVLGSSNIGLILTDREGEDYTNRLGGVDGNLRLTQKDIVRFHAVVSSTKYPTEIATSFGQPEGKFRGTAFDVGYGHETRSLRVFASCGSKDEDFRADLGFIPQVDCRYAESGARYVWNGDSERWYSKIEVGGEYAHFEESDGDLLQRGISAWLEYEGPKQSDIGIDIEYGEETFQGCRYDARRGGLHVQFWATGDLRFFLSGTGGDRIDYVNSRAGNFVRLSQEVDYRLGSHTRLYLAHTYERLDVSGGHLYSANIAITKAVYQFNRRMFLRAILQCTDYRRNTELYPFGTSTRDLSLQSQALFSYKINPRTVLFLGYSDGYGSLNELDLRQMERTFFAKIGYALAF